jgi:hypothetical protein
MDCNVEQFQKKMLVDFKIILAGNVHSVIFLLLLAPKEIIGLHSKYGMPKRRAFSMI